MEDRVVALSPCRRITLPRDGAQEVVPPTVEDVVTLTDAAPSRYRAAVVLLAGSGLRVGELLGLRVADVDFLRRSVRVERQRLQSVKQVQTVLGHASAMITLRTYAHLWPGDDDRTRSVIESTLDFLRTRRGLGACREEEVAGQGP